MPTERQEARLAARVFAVLSVFWLAARFLPAPTDPPPAVVASVAAVRVSPSPATGRFELSVPEGRRATPIAPTVDALRERLAAEVEGVNEGLARLGARAAGRIESFPDDGVTGIRLAGALVPFYDQDAIRLEAARRTITDRPWDALREIAEVLDGRLSEPQEGFLLEDSAKQRELMRFYRELADALSDAEARTAAAVQSFRQDAMRAAVEGGGPFRRRGPGRILEIVLAALLGTTLAAALRLGPRETTPDVALFFSPVFASSVVLLAEGSPLLPVDPVHGTSPAFLPLAFGLGFAGSWCLTIVSRLPRLVRDAERSKRAAEAPHPATTPEVARRPPRPLRAPRTPAPVIPPAPRRAAESEPSREPTSEPAPRAARTEPEVPGPPLRATPPRGETRFPRQGEGARLPFFPKRKSK